MKVYQVLKLLELVYSTNVLIKHLEIALFKQFKDYFKAINIGIFKLANLAEFIFFIKTAKHKFP